MTIFAHHASLRVSPTDSPAAAGPTAIPAHLGPQRPQRRTLNGRYVPTPQGSPCTRRRRCHRDRTVTSPGTVCVALPIGRPACLLTTYRRRFILLPLLGTSPVPSFPLGWPNVPLVDTS